MWLPGCGPQLRVLSVSGAVRQRRAPDPAGQTADDTVINRGRRGAAEGGAAIGAGKGGEHQDESRGDVRRGVDGNRKDKSRGDKKRGANVTHREVNESTGYGGVSKKEGRSGRDGGISGGGGGERRRARVRPYPGGLTSPGSLRGLGSRESGHASGRRRRRGRAVAGVVA